MSPSGRLIRTPTDMRGFVGSCDMVLSHLVSPSPELEPEVRKAVDAVMVDLPYVGGDPDLERCYLEQIAEPLQVLEGLGFGLFAVRTTGSIKMRNEEAIPNWTRTYFLVVPFDGYFRIEGSDRDVHSIASICRVGISDLMQAVREERGVATWHADELVAAAQSTPVTWCASCCLAESVTAQASSAVAAPELAVTSEAVRMALRDAAVLMAETGPTSAVDRLHTVMHGYLKAACRKRGIEVEDGASATALLTKLQSQSPELAQSVPHGPQIKKTLRGLGSVVDALGTVRNHGSLAHDNEMLVGPHEARLFIDAARSILNYLDAKLDGSEQ